MLGEGSCKKGSPCVTYTVQKNIITCNSRKSMNMHVYMHLTFFTNPVFIEKTLLFRQMRNISRWLISMFQCLVEQTTIIMPMLNLFWILPKEFLYRCVIIVEFALTADWFCVISHSLLFSVLLLSFQTCVM